MDERTALLTKICQERLAKQRGTLEAIRESENRAHESDVRKMKANPTRTRWDPHPHSPCV